MDVQLYIHVFLKTINNFQILITPENSLIRNTATVFPIYVYPISYHFMALWWHEKQGMVILRFWTNDVNVNKIYELWYMLHITHTK